MPWLVLGIHCAESVSCTIIISIMKIMRKYNYFLKDDLFVKWVPETNSIQCTVNTDGPVLQHKGIRNHSAEYGPMRFQLFMG